MIAELLMFNPLMGTLKPQNNIPLHSNTVIGTLAVDWCADTFGTARIGLQTPPRVLNVAAHASTACVLTSII